MYRITANQDVSFQDKIQKLIDLGRSYLSLPYGCLTRVEDETQEFVWVSGDHPKLEAGATGPLSEAYCHETIQQHGPTTVQHAAAEGWETDPAYRRYGFGTYIGTRIVVEDDLYGTFCFGGPEPRSEPYGEREQVFMELLAQWTSYELEGRRVRNRLERKNERLDRFAGVLSHDLRNPLNVASGRLELADDAIGPDHEAAAHLAAASRALTRMNEIMEDVLTLTWSGETLDSDDLSTCALNEVAAASWEQVDTAEAHLAVNGCLHLQADERRLGRLLENLFRNAVEHGRPTVTVRMGGLPDGFFVEDDGPGFPNDATEQLFDAGYSSREEGTGLGLSIVKSIADAHGWTLSAQTADTGGARFEVRGVEEID